MHGLSHWQKAKSIVRTSHCHWKLSTCIAWKIIYILCCFENTRQDADKQKNNYVTCYANAMSDSLKLTLKIDYSTYLFFSALKKKQNWSKID